MNVLPQNLAFIDLETTGADPLRDRITEIGVVTVEAGVASRWSTLVNPGQPIPPFIQNMTGIDDDMVADAPSFEDVAAELKHRLAGKLFIAHNARFDYGFVRHEFRRLGERFQSDVLCTVKLSRRLHPQFPKHGLDALIERHHLVVDGRHRALADAELIWQFWQVLGREHHEADIADAIAVQLKPIELPPALEPDVLDDVPECPGVYRFWGEDDAPLYVSKAANLRQRVLAHFAHGTREARATPVFDTLRRIDWIETAGELGAALLESQLLQELAPRHNKPQKPGSLFAWKLVERAPGDYHPELCEGEAAAPGQPGERYGLYAQKREAISALNKLAEGHGLCPAWLGLVRKLRHGCAMRGHSTCTGVCSGKEDVGLASAHLMSAISRQRQPAWPFPGAIAVVERHDFLGREDWLVIDRWRFLGLASDEKSAATLAAAPHPAFDLGRYALLKRALGKGRISLRNL